MAAGDDYLFRAAELLAKAECESDAKNVPSLKIWAGLFCVSPGRCGATEPPTLSNEPPPPKLDEPKAKS